MSERRLKVLIAGGASDSHTWNLVYLQFVVEEAGHHAVNLGPCVGAGLLAAECRRHAPDLVAVCSVNGHGHRDGLDAIAVLRGDPALAALPVVIGGKLDVDGGRDTEGIRLLSAAGYTAVYADGDTGPFRDLLATLAAGVPAVRPAQALR
jgi:methylaspartate mutase sigma subunit